MRLWIDTETYSELELKTVGAYRYAENCEILLITYALDDGPVYCHDLTMDAEPPGELLKAFANPKVEIYAHNASFDRQVLEKQLLIDVILTRWRDTMIQAFCHGLPGKLDTLCDLYKLGADQAKLKDGRKLIQLFCKPQRKNNTVSRATRETHPQEWERFKQYAMMDITAMRTLHTKMPHWNYPDNLTELNLWHLDQVKNDRGVLIDRQLGEAVLVAVEKAKTRLAKETKNQTNGGLASTTQRDATLDYILIEYGIPLDKLTKAEVVRLLEDDTLPEPLKELLRIRQQASSTSTSKYKSFLNRASKDNRYRGGIQFAGAARTSRSSGRGVQMQNLPSRGLIKDHLINEGIELMKGGLEDLVFPNVMHLASSAIRKMIIAAPGHKLCIADLSNIEGRIVAWLAEENWKIEAFQAFDKGAGPDLYNLAYARSFNIDLAQVDELKRNIGKVLELSMGYAGGCGAFVVMAAGYGFKMEELAEAVFDTLPRVEVNEAYNFLDWCRGQKRPRYGLSDKAFITADALKRLWRKAHPATIQLWEDLNNAAILAIRTKKPQTIGRLLFEMHGSWLTIQLPSGRFLCYPNARYSPDKGLSYFGMNQFTKKWEEIRTYGGKLLENISQASARDVLYHAIPRMESIGFPLVLDVHDEAVCETPMNKNVNQLITLMIQGEPWTPGLPLAAKGFEASRYRKG